MCRGFHFPKPVKELLERFRYNEMLVFLHQFSKGGSGSNFSRGWSARETGIQSMSKNHCWSRCVDFLAIVAEVRRKSMAWEFALLLLFDFCTFLPFILVCINKIIARNGSSIRRVQCVYLRWSGEVFCRAQSICQARKDTDCVICRVRSLICTAIQSYTILLFWAICRF